MIYTGMKVKVKNEDSCAVGALLSFYQKNGYFYVSRIFDNGKIFLSDSPNGLCSVSTSIDNITPLYNDDILKVLEEKKRMIKSLEKEIEDIEQFIIERCKD